VRWSERTYASHLHKEKDLSIHLKQKPTPSDQLSLAQDSLKNLVIQAENQWGDTPLPTRVFSMPAMVEKVGHRAQNKIDSGRNYTPVGTPPPLSVNARQGQNLEQAQKILEEYEQCGAVKRVTPQGTKHLLPWFLISKPEEGGGVKWRFISDCREINQFFEVKKFKLDHLQQIYPTLQKGHWGAKIDLKDAYFHLSINEKLKPFLRHRVGDQVWEYQAGPFGLNIMPQLFQSVMHTFEKKWRHKGVQVYIYTWTTFWSWHQPPHWWKNI
jgi:hypothetical protein